MVILIPIKYHKRNYPFSIKANIQEVAGHFDIIEIKPTMNYSLHTEYSAYESRKLDSPLLTNLSTIKCLQKEGIPQLWMNERWVLEFVEFIKNLVNNNKSPTIIEVHPPFNDYCSSITQFIEIYKVFERECLRDFTNTQIVIENRSGTRYKGGEFLISNENDLIELCRIITKDDLKLRIVLDIPQLFTNHNLTIGKFSKEEISMIFNSLKPIRGSISGIHIWGKKKSDKGRIISHVGNLDTYFHNTEVKLFFLNTLHDLLDDGRPRYFVPEVNSSDYDVASIVNDFITNKFNFSSSL